MNKPTILIVDDESSNISILVEILKEKHNLLVATDGLTALEIAKSERPNLILLDIIMPDMNGYEVAYELKYNKVTSDIPFIFLTAKSDSKSVVEGFKRGAVDYISKPFAKEELLARVHNQIQIHKLKDSLSNAFGEVHKKNAQLTKNRHFLESILANSSHAIITTDTNGIVTLFNKAAQNLLGYSEDEVLNKLPASIFHDKEQMRERSIEFSKELDQEVKNDFELFIIKSRLGLENKHEWTYITKESKRLTVNLSVSILKGQNNEIEGYIGIAEDITQKKRAQKLINNYMELINENVITSTTDLEGNITYVSEAFCKISGYKKEELLGRNHNIARHSDMSREIFEEMWRTIKKNMTWHGILKNIKRDGGFYWADTKIYPVFDDDGNKIGYTAIRHDITDQKKIEEISIRDELTGLYNRRYFNEVLPNELNRAKREERHIAFFMLDVDHFKLYNDTYGHQEGDKALQKVGEVLNTFAKRASDFAFRLGGEEFGMIFQEETLNDAVNFALNIKNAVKELNIKHEKNSCSDVMTVSIGLIFIESEDYDTNEIYKKADEKLYLAKNSGRNRVEF